VSSTYRLADFVGEIESLYKAAEPESFWLCEDAVRRLLAGNTLNDWIKQELRSLISNPYHVGDWSSSEVVLHRGKTWTLSVSILDAPKRFIHVLPFLAIYAPVDSSLTGNRYRLPDVFRNDVFDPGVRLEPAGVVSANPREPLRLETGRYAYDFNVAGPLPFLRFATVPLRPLEWLFSKSTLQAWQANDAEVSFTQLRVAAYVLGKIAHDSSVRPLRDLAAHPHHAVRWAAIQNLGRLSRTEALAKIRDAINDPHPHVRRAAQKTLDQLDRRNPR
jgi:hypothetical protein